MPYSELHAVSVHRDSLVGAVKELIHQQCYRNHTGLKTLHSLQIVMIVSGTSAKCESHPDTALSICIELKRELRPLLQEVDHSVPTCS